MSKISAKQRVEQLKEWMSFMGIKQNKKPAQTQSRSEYYKEKGVK